MEAPQTVRSRTGTSTTVLQAKRMMAGLVAIGGVRWANRRRSPIPRVQPQRGTELRAGSWIQALIKGIIVDTAWNPKNMYKWGENTSDWKEST